MWRGVAAVRVVFPGGYRDKAGYEAITWRVEGSRRHKLPSLDVFTAVRGIGLQGTDFDGLGPADPSAAVGRLPLSQAGELTGCVLSGDLPCTAATGGQRRPATIAFSLDLRSGTAVPPGPAHALTVSLVLDGVTYQAADDWFEGGVQRLEQALPPGAQLVCCLTCLFSDYSPGGHGLTASAATAEPRSRAGGRCRAHRRLGYGTFSTASADHHKPRPRSGRPSCG